MYWTNRVEFELALNNLTATQVELLQRMGHGLTLQATDPSKVWRYFQDQKAKNNILLRQAVGGCASVVANSLTHQVAVNSLRGAVACERYRLVNGQWPATLDVLVPNYLAAVPLDSFTGKPLLYRLLPEGVVVYSVGKDGNDDQGDVLEISGMPKDKGTRLFNPELRGKNYQQPKSRD